MSGETRQRACWCAAFGFVSIAFALNLHAAAPVPPSQIKTPDGRTVRLYNMVGPTQPTLGGLRQRGFLNAFNYDRPFPPTAPPTAFNVNAPRLALLQDGSADEFDVRSQMVQVCAQRLNPAESSLVILDTEWGADEATHTDYSVLFYKESLWHINPDMLANTKKILQWMKRGFDDSTCRGHVRIGWYGSVDTWWNSFYDDSISQDMKDQHDLIDAEIVNTIKDVVDVLAPTFYTRWTPDDDPYLGEPEDPSLGPQHEQLWGTAVDDTLRRAREFVANTDKAVIPFIGLRYYFVDERDHDDPEKPTAEEIHYLHKYVDAGFFGKMIRKISDSACGCEGAVFFDWYGYGGPRYRNDGTDFFNKSESWYQTTFSYFSAPADNTAAVKNLIDELTRRN